MRNNESTKSSCYLATLNEVLILNEVTVLNGSQITMVNSQDQADWSNVRLRQNPAKSASEQTSPLFLAIYEHTTLMKLQALRRVSL